MKKPGLRNTSICFLLFADGSFDSLDMYISFGVCTKVRKSAGCLGNEHVSGERKWTAVILRAKGNNGTGKVKWEREGYGSTREGIE